MSTIHRMLLRAFLAVLLVARRRQRLDEGFYASDAVKDALAGSQKVEIRGFGSFKVVAKKTGFGRDIRRKKQIKIAEGRRVKFRCGQDLKHLLNK